MEFEPSVAVWRGRGGSAALDVSAANGKDGSKLVLVTTREEVLEYCTQSRQCVHHWTFRAGSSVALRIGAVRNPTSHVLFGVRGAKKANQPETLVAWRNSDVEVAKWKSAPLAEKSAVAGLFVHPQLTEEVVVVFENGRFAFYDEDLAKLLDTSDTLALNVDDVDVDGHVVYAALASDHRNPVRGALFLSLLLKTNASTDAPYELVIYQVFTKKDRKDTRVAATLAMRHPVTLQDRGAAAQTDATIASAAFHADTFSFSFVWSTGEWQMVTFQHDAVTNALAWTSSQVVASFAADYTVPSSLMTPTTHKKRKLAHATSAATGLQICGVGHFSYLVVSSASTPRSLAGWDSKFGVQVATTEIDVSSPETDGSDVDATPTAASTGALLKLVSSQNGEVVVAAYEHAVFFVNVKNKHSTLASVVGAAAWNSATSTAPGLPNSAINWADVAATPVAASDWTAQLCSDSAAEQQFIADLSDASVTATAAQFHKKFADALTALRSRGRELSYRFLLAVTTRCVESPTLGLWKPLATMIESKRISARAVPALLPTLMTHRQYALLELAIRHLTDIDERSIVRLLKFFIRVSEDTALLAYVSKAPHAAAGSKRKKPAAASSEVVSASKRFLVALLALPTNSVFLHHAIRELQLEDALLLLAICKKFLCALTIAHDSAEDADAAATTKKKKASKKSTNGVAHADASSSLAALVSASARETLYFTKLPTAFQFAAWICALIDGHFAQLVLAASKDATVAAGLQRLDALVKKQLEACEQFEEVQSVLTNVLSGVKLPQAHGIPDYSIEELLI